eukprot:594714_1
MDYPDEDVSESISSARQRVKRRRYLLGIIPLSARRHVNITPPTSNRRASDSAGSIPTVPSFSANELVTVRPVKWWRALLTSENAVSVLGICLIGAFMVLALDFGYIRVSGVDNMVPVAVSCDSWAWSMDCGLDAIDCTPLRFESRGRMLARAEETDNILYNPILDSPTSMNVWTPIRCPSFCPRNTGASVTGSGTYSAYSNVCAAAVHSGAISWMLGGVALIRAGPSQHSFTSSHQHGVASRSSVFDFPISFEFKRLDRTVWVDPFVYLVIGLLSLSAILACFRPWKGALFGIMASCMYIFLLFDTQTDKPASYSVALVANAAFPVASLIYGVWVLSGRHALGINEDAILYKLSRTEVVLSYIVPFFGASITAKFVHVLEDASWVAYVMLTYAWRIFVLVAIVYLSRRLYDAKLHWPYVRVFGVLLVCVWLEVTTGYSSYRLNIHYALAACVIVVMARFRTRFSRVSQAIALGVCVYFVATYNTKSVFQMIYPDYTKPFTPEVLQIVPDPAAARSTPVRAGIDLTLRLNDSTEITLAWPVPRGPQMPTSTAVLRNGVQKKQKLQSDKSPVPAPTYVGKQSVPVRWKRILIRFIYYGDGLFRLIKK